MNNDNNNNSAGSLKENKQQTTTNNNNKDVDNNDTSFDVTVEEAVYKYVRDLNFDYTNNISNNSTPNNLNSVLDHEGVTNLNSLSPSLEWYLKDDNNFGSPPSDGGNKRELYELDQLFPSKKLKETSGLDKNIATETNKQSQDGWISPDFLTRDEETSLGPQFYNSPNNKRSFGSPNINSQNILSNPNIGLPTNEHFQKILPKTKEVKRNYSGILPDEPKKKRDLKLLIEEMSRKLSQLSTEIKSQLKFAPEEDALIKEFITRYETIQGLTLNEVTHIIWHSNIFVDEPDKTQENQKTKNKVSTEMIDLFWTSVYSILPYRLNSSIYKHVKRLYNNFDKRGKWTHKEDEALNDLCIAKGLMGQWLQIGSIMNRMPEDCRDRWRNYVMCQGKQKMNQWSIQEEERLLVIILNSLKNKAMETTGDMNLKFTKDGLLHDDELFKHAINWTQVSESMGLTRSRIQCRYKWNKLFRRRMLRRINNEMDNDDVRKILLTCENKWNTVDEVDWDQLSKDIEWQWYPKELKLFFEVKGKRIKNYKDLTLKEVCTKMLAQLKN